MLEIKLRRRDDLSPACETSSVIRVHMLRNRVARTLSAVALGLGNSRECPLCGWTGRRFLTQPNPRQPRRDAVCPQCGSTERQRLARLLVDIGHPDYTLHVAPDGVAGWLRSASVDYLSVDLYAPAMRKADVTDLPFEDQTFDLIWCSHVLEHVEQDRQAMRELHRVLKPGGLAIVQVPIWREATFEDPTITTPEERSAVFYQSDHVRLYGLDIVQRLQQAGFAVSTLTIRRLPVELITRHSLSHLPTNEIFVCTR